MRKLELNGLQKLAVAEALADGLPQAVTGLIAGDVD